MSNSNIYFLFSWMPIIIMFKQHSDNIGLMPAKHFTHLP